MAAAPKPEPPEKTERDLFRVMMYSTALAFGGMGAFLGSFRHIRQDPTLAFSWGTLIGFVIGAVIGWGLWRFVKHLIDKDRSRLP